MAGAENTFGSYERFDLAAQHLGAAHEAALEFSHTQFGDGLRGRYAFGVIWMRGALMQARPLRDSFALVELGAPNIRVLRDRQIVGRTDEHGRALITGLRANEANRIGIELDDLTFMMLR